MKRFKEIYALTGLETARRLKEEQKDRGKDSD
jgi:hypothetical protein